jgi:type I restriction enzyme S subunit
VSAVTLKRVQYSTEVIAWQINPADLGDAEVVHYSIPALQETGRPAIEPANEIASNKWSLRGGEVLVSKLNVHKNCVAIVERHDDLPLVSSTEFVPFVPTGIEPRYLKYVFQSEETIQHLTSFSESATRSHARVNPSDIIKLKVHQPDFSIQESIADYLDRETAHIDGLIAEKERMLALLEEKRAALISRVVTRGLDPNAPLKPSGQEWLGEIPAHWELRTLKRASSKIETGTTPAASFMDGSLFSDFTWFTPGDFVHGGVISESHRKIPQEAVEQGEAKVFPAHSLMVIGIGATLGKVASCGDRFSANQQINVITPLKSVRWDYLLYVLEGYERVFRAHANSATLSILNQERLGVIRVPVPPLAEQDEIVKRLNEFRAEYAEVSQLLWNSISLLKERRAALITSAVTGQIPLKEMAG